MRSFACSNNHTGCTNTDKHFHEIRTADREKFTPASDTAFARSVLPVEFNKKNTLRNSGAKFNKLSGLFQKLHNFHQIFFFFVCTSNIINLTFILSSDAILALLLPKDMTRFATALRLLDKEDQNRMNNDNYQCRQDGQPPNDLASCG